MKTHKHKNMPGRPPIIETPQQFDDLADAYFAKCEADKQRPTVNGLTLALGYVHRQSLFDCAEREGFSDTVKRARTRLEAAWESGLCGINVAGTIFWLKNHGWRDTIDQHHSGGMTLEQLVASIQRKPDAG